MIVYIPIRSTEVIDERVNKALMAQSIESEIVLVETSPVSNCKRKGEFEGRDKIKSLASAIKDEYVTCNDSDSVHLFTDNLSLMKDYLEKNLSVGVVALWGHKNKAFQYPQNRHITLACTMWRREVLANICSLDFEGSDYKGCCCQRYKDSVIAQGYEMRYLDGMVRIKEIA